MAYSFLSERDLISSLVPLLNRILKFPLPNDGNDGAALVGALGVGAAAAVGRGVIIINGLGLGLSLGLRVVNPVNDVFTDVIGEKTILLTTMGVDNGANRDGVVDASRMHGKELLNGGLIHVVC